MPILTVEDGVRRESEGSRVGFVQSFTDIEITAELYPMLQGHSAYSHPSLSLIAGVCVAPGGVADIFALSPLRHIVTALSQRRMERNDPLHLPHHHLSPPISATIHH